MVGNRASGTASDKATADGEGDCRQSASVRKSVSGPAVGEGAGVGDGSSEGDGSRGRRRRGSWRCNDSI